MNRIIKLFLCVLAMITSIAICSPYAKALEYDDNFENIDVYSPTPYFTYILSTSTGLSLSNGMANGIATLSCNSNKTNSCSATAYFQRRLIGTTTWYTLFSVTDNGTFYATAFDKCSVTPGYQYRVKAQYTAKGSNGSDTTYSYSKIVTVS